MADKFLGKSISGCFTIPSGIVTTNVKVIEKIANEIPEIGVITTKSIGISPRDGNREPIFAQYAPGCFVNAVGLTNPGAEEFVKRLSKINIPEDRFLLVSIFGKDADEFVSVAKIVAPVADGLELNLSCPHASGYGMAIGQDPDLVKNITRAVKNAVDIPVVPKLTPNVSNIGIIAQAAVAGGADAICAINTVGPGYYTVDGNPVLTNKKGGMSGKGILPIGLKCVKEIADAVNVPIIGCGGISSATDIKEYQKAGARIFGIGSALIGLSTKQIKEYFRVLNQDVKTKTCRAVKLLKQNVNMDFKKYRIIENKKLADDLSIIVFDKSIGINAGQFVFAWIPEVGEKPFSVLDDDPLTLMIYSKGCFTKKLTSLSKGSEVYFRGPHGNAIEIKKNPKIFLVSGGCGMAAVYQIARDFNNTELFVGAKDKDHLFYTEKAKDYSDVYVATDDGSKGYHGFVTDLLKEKLEEMQNQPSLKATAWRSDNAIFFNCGPEQMIKTATEIEKKFTSADKIYNSIDYVTKCGVGICGSCTSVDGRRLCVDGPFLAHSKKIKDKLMRIDPHVHFRDEEQSYKETIVHGLQIAKEQGVEYVFDMPNTARPILREKDVLRRLSLVPVSEKGRYFLYVGATNNTEQLKEAVKLVENFREVVGIKMYAGRSTGDLAIISEQDQKKVYQILADENYKGVLAVHCEKEKYINNDLFDPKNVYTHALARPNIAEIESIKDQIKFAENTGFQGILHICHVSCGKSVETIDIARSRMKITCGITPHHLFRSNKILKSSKGLLYKTNPPLREVEDVIALRQSLRNGKINWIETDHAPHTIGEKLYGSHPSGFPSLYLYKKCVEEFLPVLGLNDSQIKDLTFNNIIKTFGLKL